MLRTYPATDPQAAIRAVLTGAADLVGGIQPQEVDTLMGRPDLSVHELHMFTSSFVSMNPEGEGKSYLADPRVRIALGQAINRQKIVNEVLAGRADPNPNPIPTADWAYSAAAANKYPFDSAAAATALDAAGWTQDPVTKLRTNKGKPFHVTLVAADSFPNQQVAQAISQQLGDLGIQVGEVAVPDLAIVVLQRVRPQPLPERDVTGLCREVVDHLRGRATLAMVQVVLPRGCNTHQIQR